MARAHLVSGTAIAAIGMVLLFLALERGSTEGMIVGGLLVVAGGALSVGATPRVLKGGPISIEFWIWRRFQRVESIAADENVEVRRLTSEELQEKQIYAGHRQIPGDNAQPFNLITDYVDYRRFPAARLTTPMYALDASFRILDWNEAFRLAFDNTMEGRKGQSVLEWVFFLDNWRDAIDHGERRFSDADALPEVDVELLVFESHRYGRISATKRAFRIPEDDERGVRGWLALLDLDFDEEEKRKSYYSDLAQALDVERLWAEYAKCYDPVLLSTKVYPELLDMMLGTSEELPSLRPISAGARVLDLGAGTGNLSIRLADRCTIFAFDKSEVMLDHLRAKCAKWLRADDRGLGVIPVKQDIRSLFGLGDNAVDVILSNNVLYGLSDEDTLSALREAWRVLRRGGEIRMSGPQEKTNIDKLFVRIRKDLSRAGRLAELQAELAQVHSINRLALARMPGFRRSPAQQRELLEKAGFTDVEIVSDRAYAGQALILRGSKD